MDRKLRFYDQSVMLFPCHRLKIIGISYFEVKIDLNEEGVSPSISVALLHLTFTIFGQLVLVRMSDEEQKFDKLSYNSKK